MSSQASLHLASLDVLSHCLYNIYSGTRPQLTILFHILHSPSTHIHIALSLSLSLSLSKTHTHTHTWDPTYPSFSCNHICRCKTILSSVSEKIDPFFNHQESIHLPTTRNPATGFSSLYFFPKARYSMSLIVFPHPQPPRLLMPDPGLAMVLNGIA